VRVHARAVNVALGKVLFSVKEHRKIKKFRDVFELEDALAQKIIFQLGLKISRQQLDEIEKITTSSQTAFELYSTGFRFMDMGDFETGLKHIQRAAEMDKNFDWADKVRIRAQQAFEELERKTKR
jgi:hypothetical protein